MTTNNPHPNSHFVSELNMNELDNIQMLTTNPCLTKKEIEESSDSNHLFPVTKRQAEYFIASDNGMCAICRKDVELIEALLNKHGMRGRYQYTKSHRSVHFLSNAFLEKALRAEYGIQEQKEEEE